MFQLKKMIQNVLIVELILSLFKSKKKKKDYFVLINYTKLFKLPIWKFSTFIVFLVLTF